MSNILDILKYVLLLERDNAVIGRDRDHDGQRNDRRGVIQAVHVVTVMLRTPHPTRSSLGSVLDSGATLVESVAPVGID